MTKRKKSKYQDIIDLCREVVNIPEEMLDELEQEIDHTIGIVKKGSQEELDVFYRSKLFCFLRQFHDDIRTTIINRPILPKKEKT